MDKYEKLYNEALEHARAEILANPGLRKTWEEIFPELRESEDERIRKAIRCYVEDMPDTYGFAHGIGKADMLAWLEKQKEQPTNEEMLRTLRAEYEKGVADTIAKYEQKEQKEIPLMNGDADLYFDNWRQKVPVPTFRQCFEEGMRYAQRLQKEQKPVAEEILAKAGLKPYKDGNQWCILAGDNIQDGICGFGDTIDEALYEFLKEVLIMANSPQLEFSAPQTDTITDWAKLQLAIAMTESEFKADAVGTQGDYGLYQMRAIYVAEVNRVCGTDYKHEDALDPDKAIEIFNAMQGYYNPTRDMDTALRYHNKSSAYKRKVLENLAFVERYEAFREALTERISP